MASSHIIAMISLKTRELSTGGKTSPLIKVKPDDYASVFQFISNMARQNARAYDSYSSRVAVIGDGGRSHRRVP
jgi:hypothetical protein